MSCLQLVCQHPKNLLPPLWRRDPPFIVDPTQLMVDLWLPRDPPFLVDPMLYITMDPLPLEHQMHLVHPPVNMGAAKIFYREWGCTEYAMRTSNNMSSLPKTHIYTRHYDVLGDDGLFFAHRLHHAGNDVTAFNVRECHHLWPVLPGSTVPTSLWMFDWIVRLHSGRPVTVYVIARVTYVACTPRVSMVAREARQ